MTNAATAAAPAPAADQQGDISQARGMLGQLLFEFGQLELNKDLLEAIKRTESRTGAAQLGGRYSVKAHCSMPMLNSIGPCPRAASVPGSKAITCVACVQ